MTSIAPSEIAAPIPINSENIAGLKPVTIKIIMIALTIFYLYTFIRLRALAASSAISVNTGGEDAGGDIFKQISYIGMFALFMFIYFYKFGARLPKSFDFVQPIILSWIIISSSWAPDPSLSFRRAVLTTIIVVIIGLAVDLINVTRALRSLYWAVTLGLIFSYIAVFFYPSYGIHPADEIDPTLVGAWRGVFSHKNIAGGIASIACIIYIHNITTKFNIKDTIFLIIGLLFIYKSHSKSSIGFFAVAIIFKYSYQILFRYAMGRILLYCLAGYAVIAAIVIFCIYEDNISRLFRNPQALSGRVAIWETAWNYAITHPFFGSGYNFFWPQEQNSPSIATRYMTQPFERVIGHSHNGYLELFVTTGIGGLIMAVFATIVIPLRNFASSYQKGDINEISLLLGIWIFGVLDNMMEPQLYTRDRQVWCMMATAMFSINILRQRTRSIEVDEIYGDDARIPAASVS